MHSLASSGLLLVLAATAAQAQAPMLTLENPEPVLPGSFANAAAAVDDADGDGTSDFLLGGSVCGSTHCLGRAYLYSGATGANLYTFQGNTSVLDGFGWDVAGVPDADGDGRGDVAVGAYAEQPEGTSGQGSVYLYSGSTGALVHRLRVGHPGAIIGDGVAGVPDVDGDGLGDILAGSANEGLGAGKPDAGRAYVFSGATGAIIRTLESPTPRIRGFFGRDVAGARDLDGDGRGDLAIGAPGDTDAPGDTGRVYVFSGASGAVLHTLHPPTPTTPEPFPVATNFGESLATVPDVDGDGLDDVLVGARNLEEAYLFSGATGALLHVLRAPAEIDAQQFGLRVAAAHDLDTDGWPDVLVGAEGESIAGAGFAGAAYVFSGASGELLQRLQSPAPEGGGAYGGAVAGLGDTDGDGRGEVLVGARGEGAFGEPNGRAYLYSGAVATAGVAPPQPRDLGISVGPMPAAHRAMLRLTLPEADAARITLHDALGRELAVFHEGLLAPGAHAFPLDMTSRAPGVYLIRVTAGPLSGSTRLVVAR